MGKVELRSFVPKLLNLPGRTSWPNSPRDLQGGSPSGSERGQARRLVIPRLQRVVKTKKLLLRKKKRNTTKKKRKKRRRKRSKLSLDSSPGFLSRARHQTFHTSHCFRVYISIYFCFNVICNFSSSPLCKMIHGSVINQSECKK